MEKLIPKLKENVTLKNFDTSSKKSSYILVLDDNQWQISENLYSIISFIDGERDVKEIAESVSKQYKQYISEDQIKNIIENNLTKLGILEGTECKNESKKNSSKYLWLKIEPIKSIHIQKLKFLSLLFKEKIFIVLAIISILMQAHLLISFINEGGFKIVTDINGIVAVYLIFIAFVATICHELGHMAACMRYDVKPGNIGFAFYFIKPVMYSDVTRIWQLKRKERAVVDVGGMYFEVIVLSIMGILGLILNNNYILICVSLMFIGLTMNLNPFLKWDGYWILSDLTGIPNLHRNMKEYIITKFKLLFKINSKTYIDDIKKTEKIIFNIYIVFCGIFLVYYMYILLLMIPSVIHKLPNLIGIFNYNYEVHSYLEIIKFLVGYLYENVLTVVLSVILIRTFIVIGSQIIKGTSKLIKLIKHRM